MQVRPGHESESTMTVLVDYQSGTTQFLRMPYAVDSLGTRYVPFRFHQLEPGTDHVAVLVHAGYDRWGRHRYTEEASHGQ